MSIKRSPRLAIALAATAAAGLSGVAIAGAADTTTTTSSSSTTTTQQQRPNGGPGFGHGGHRDMGANLAAVAKTLGVSTSDLQKAVQAARPAQGDKPDKGDFAAALAKQLGVSTSDVQSVLDANRPTSRPAPGTKPDDSALVSALASKFSISTDAAQAALDAVHKAHDANRAAAMDDFFAAVAKSLGKDSAAVKQAFEANRPAPPTH